MKVLDKGIDVVILDNKISIILDKSAIDSLNKTESETVWFAIDSDGTICGYLEYPELQSTYWNSEEENILNCTSSKIEFENDTEWKDTLIETTTRYLKRQLELSL